MPKKIWDMEEINKLSDEAYVELLPDDFLLDPEGYCRKFGKTEYYRFLNVVSCTNSVRLKLNNGDMLNYKETIYVYEPLFPSAASN